MSVLPSFGDCASLVFLSDCTRPLPAGAGTGGEAPFLLLTLYYLLYY